jgi:small subunit ribosomal protein S15
VAETLQKIAISVILSPMLTKRKKQNVIRESQVHETDTGSPEVQASILTKRIDELATHLKKNPKDIHSRRGLLQMVADRRKHLKYIEKTDKRRYNALIKKLDLKR